MAKGKGKELTLDGVGRGTVPTLSELAANKTPMRITVPIVLDSLKANRVKDADTEFVRAELNWQRLGKKDEGPAAERLADARIELAEAQGDAETATYQFVIEAMPRAEIEEMIAAHKPTDKQIRAYREQHLKNKLPMNEPLGYNSDTFPPALLSRCIVDPSVSIEEADMMWNGDGSEAGVWSQGELGILFQACLSVNQTVG